MRREEWKTSIELKMSWLKVGDEILYRENVELMIRSNCTLDSYSSSNRSRTFVSVIIQLEFSSLCIAFKPNMMSFHYTSWISFFITSQILSTRARAFTLHVVSSTVSTKLNTSALCLLRFVWMLEKCTFSELFHSHSRSSLSHAFPSSYFSRSVAVLCAVLARSSRFECCVEKGKAVLMLLWVMNSFKEFPYAVF